MTSMLLQVHGALLQLEQLVTAATQVLEDKPAWLIQLPLRLQACTHLLSVRSSACPAVRAAFLNLVILLYTAFRGQMRSLAPAGEMYTGGLAAAAGEASHPNDRACPSNHAASTEDANQQPLAALLGTVQTAAAEAVLNTSTVMQLLPDRQIPEPGRRISIHDASSTRLARQASHGFQQPFEGVWLKRATQAAISRLGGLDVLQLNMVKELLQHGADEVRAAAAKSVRKLAPAGKDNPEEAWHPLACFVCARAQQRAALSSLVNLDI